MRMPPREAWTATFDEDRAFRGLVEFVNWHLKSDSTKLPRAFGDGSRGKFLNLPFKKWLKRDSAAYESVIVSASRDLMANPAFLSCLVGQYMPAELIKRLMGPSRPDMNKPALEFKRFDISAENYQVMKDLTYRQKEDEEVARKAFRGMIACYLQRYFHRYLCGGCELISTFDHPAAQDLSLEKQLAVEIMREVLILPVFGSMHQFWREHARMMEDGGHLIGYYSSYWSTADQIKDLLKEDTTATAMFELCLDVGMPTDDFNMAMQSLCRPIPREK